MRDSNPFATRFTRPGAIDFLFPPGKSAESLVALLRKNLWWGEIVGPHGSGKSTLLAALTPALRAAGRKVVRMSVSPDGSGRPESVTPAATYESIVAQELEPSSQLVLDGYERISWWWRRRVQALCRLRGAGLLVTVHQSIGLPTIFRTQPSRQLAQEIVNRLLPAGQTTITPADVETAYTASGGNLRETLFVLFDVYQSRRK